MGYLIPVHVQECVPTDKFHIDTQAMVRMMPMIAPIMHKLNVTIHHFFVPTRIVWPGFEDFIAPKTNTAIPPAFPILNFGDPVNEIIAESSLGDYMGLPTGVDMLTAGAPVSAVPFAAYQRIWHEYYRDQNMQDEPEIVLANGSQSNADTTALLKLQKRGWGHDYLTSCLPFAQKGQPVELPMDFNNAPIILDTTNGAQTIVDIGGVDVLNSALGSDATDGRLRDTNSTDNVWIDPRGSLEVDGSQLHSTTSINDLRTAYSLQRWLELAARAGTRFVEVIRGFFNGRTSDARLQRPEYLGGVKSSMSISEVLQTGETTVDSPQGNMAGHGISVIGGNGSGYRCEEWGYIISVMSIMPTTAYFQGLPRHFSRVIDRFQYPWPQFALLGEQPVLNKEVYLDETDPAYNEGTFGYLPIYSDYRYNPSRVSGALRTSLDFWHMGRKFTTQPHLNSTFIACDPTKRIFAVDDPDVDEIVCHIYHKIRAVRPLPRYGNPGWL